jgi:chromosome segregation ATPase
VPKAVADQMAIVNAQIAHSNPDAVQIMYGELQSALQEIEERKKIEETFKQQVKVLEPQSFSLGAAMELQNNDLEARNSRRANMWALKNLHSEFSEALEDLETANPGVDTSKLAELALKLGCIAQKIERYDEYSVTNTQTQLNNQKKRTAFHRNRASALRAERNIAQTTLAMIQQIGLRTLNGAKGPNKFRSIEAKVSLDSMVAKALMEMQAVSAELETPVEPITPENEDDASDAAEDENTKPKGNFADLDKVVDSFRKTVEHAIATGKTLQTIPTVSAALERPSQTVFAVMKDADKKAWDAEIRAKTAGLALAAETLEAELCNQKLEQLQANGMQASIVQASGTQANGTGGIGLGEGIISAYLEMAKSNITNGQVLIDRIECLEKCVLGCNENNSKKRKRGCDGYHARVGPDVLQGLIQRLTDEIPPQADLVTKIVNLLTVLKARLEQRARGVSPHKRLSSGSEDSIISISSQDSVMSNTGGLDTQALLQLNFANVQNGEILISRIAELESELHYLQTHSGGAPNGDEDCPRKLEQTKKQIQDLTSQVINLDSELHALKSHSAEAPSGNDDCPGRLKRAGERNQALIKRIGDLEFELHTVKTHSHGEPGGDKDCPKELEKARKQLKELTDKLKTSEEEIEQLEGDKAWYEDYLEEHDRKRDDAESDKIEELKDQIAALKAQVEQLKKEKREVEKRRDICYNYNLDILEPTLAARNTEIRRLKDDVYDLDGLQASLDACLERNTKAQAELNAYHLADAINLDLELRGARENEEYAALLVKIKFLKNKWRNCEEARGNKVVDSDDDSGYEEEEEADLMENLALLSRADLLDVLRRVVKFEALYLKQTDDMGELTENNEYRQRELMRNLGDANLKISQAETTSQKLNDIIGDLKAEIKNLKSSLKNCQEFRDSVLRLGIDEPEEPRDLEGLDNAALIEEIIDLQRRLKALGIKYEEAMENEQTFDTDSELSEDVEFQNPRQQILDLRATLADVRAALKRCNETHEETVDNPEDAASMALLKEGIQKLRDERDEARDKLRSCEDEVDRLIKELQKQLDARERDLGNEKEQAKKQAGKEASYENTITVLVDGAKEDKDFYEAKIKRLNDLIAQINKDLLNCLETREVSRQGAAYLTEGLAQRDEEVEGLEAELASRSPPVSPSQQSLKAQIKKLKKELADCKAHCAGKDEQIVALQQQLEACKAEQDRLEEGCEANFRKWVEGYKAKTQKNQNDWDELQKMIDDVKDSVRNEDDLEEDYEGKITALEMKHHSEMVVLIRRIRELEDQLIGVGYAPGTIGAAVQEAKLAAIQKLNEQKQNCEAEKKELQKKIEDLEKNASTSQGANPGDVEQLQEQLAQIKAELQAEKKKAAASNRAAKKNFTSLEKEKQKTAKCQEKLADLRAEHPTTGLGNRKSPRKRPASEANDGEPDEECLEDCIAELAKLKHEIASLRVERTRLKARLQEQDDETDNYEEGARRSKRHKQQLSEELVIDEDDEDEEQDDLQPLEDNNFDPHNGACNGEIEALNNQITVQKQELAALEQQAELDKLQVDALKHGNTDKSKAHQKFAALIEKLRTELEDLQARLAECRPMFPYLLEEES